MPASEPPLEVKIPKPSEERPVWSRVGIVGVLGFVIGIAWPRLAGIKIGPSVPADLRATAEASAPPPAAAPRTSGSSSAPAASASVAADATSANQELVVAQPGKITKCFDKKDKKIEDCDKVAFDAIVLPKLKELAKCPSALGLEGKMPITIEVAFDKKEMSVGKAKKGGTSLPSSTVNGILQCAAKEFSGVALEEVQHKYRRYSLLYTAEFSPPGKHGDQAKDDGDKGDDKDAADDAPKTKGEEGATGSAIVSWDTALVRKEPKDGDVVARVVRGTKVKLIGKQNDWYKVEIGSKTGWVYRGSIGL